MLTMSAINTLYRTIPKGIKNTIGRNAQITVKKILVKNTRVLIKSEASLIIKVVSSANNIPNTAIQIIVLNGFQHK